MLPTSSSWVTVTMAVQYRVTYRFTSTDGRTVQDGQTIGVDAWEAFTEQGPVAIEYMASDPGRNRVAGTDGWVLAWLMLAFGGALSAVGGTLFLWGRFGKFGCSAACGDRAFVRRAR